MKKENVIKSCYDVMKRLTPLHYDCGKLCNGKCCGGDDNTGMILFPGEENFIDDTINIKECENGLKVAVCNGSCDRRKRPLSCRIFPLFPSIKEDEGGEYVEIEFDSRADCPLLEGNDKIDRRFCKAVKRVGKYLLLNDETAHVYRYIDEEIKEINTLKKLFEK